MQHIANEESAIQRAQAINKDIAEIESKLKESEAKIEQLFSRERNLFNELI